MPNKWTRTKTQPTTEQKVSGEARRDKKKTWSEKRSAAILEKMKRDEGRGGARVRAIPGGAPVVRTKGCGERLLRQPAEHAAKWREGSHDGVTKICA